MSITNPTQAELAAWAKVVGITPETLVCPDCMGYGFWWDEGDGPSYVNSYNGKHKVACETCGGDFDSPGTGSIQSHLPTPADPDRFDDVFLAPTLRWLQKQNHEPVVKGRDPEHSTDFMADVGDGIDCVSFDDCATITLLLAAHEAGVPEVRATFGESTHED